MNIKRGAFALAALCAMTTAAAAQDAGYPPIARDLPQGYEFADGSVPEMLGIMPGMARADAEALLQKNYPGGTISGDDVLVSLVNEHGARFAMRYHERDLVTADLDGGGSLTLTVIYTTGVSGERVASIKREIAYGSEQPEMATFIAAVTAKYGPPSAVVDGAGNDVGKTLLYVWLNGRLVSVNPDDYDSPGSPCLMTLNKVPYSISPNANPVTAHSNAFPGCTAMMSLVLHAGKGEDRIGNLFQKFTDYQRYIDDALAADAFLADGLSKDQTGPAPVPAM